MANVTATDRMRDDPRFDTAGVLLGIDGDLVRFRMIRLWSWQTEHYTPETPTYVVSRVALVGMFKSAGAPEALVDSDLAEVRDGGFYIRGTEGAIEWLWKKRCAGAKGYAEKVKRSAAQGVPKQDLGDAQVMPSPRDPVSGIRNPDSFSLGGARDPAPPAPAAQPYAPASRLVALAVDLLNAARLEIDPTAQPIDADQGDEMAAAGHLRAIHEDKREAAIRHGVAAIAASVKAGRDTVAALRPGELFGPRSWRKWQAAPTEFTPRGRDGPSGKPRALGQAHVSPTAVHVDGDQAL